jgi:hypothetical protein
MSCPRCPHCIAGGACGLIDPSDPALTTNKATTSRPCRDCGENGREASKRHDICTRCWDVRVRVVNALNDKTITAEQFRLYQNNGLRFKRLRKIGLQHLAEPAHA